MNKQQIAKKIANWLEKNDLTHEVRIYFDNQCWTWNDEEMIVIDDMKASNYFEYANDETISMSFEGPLYHVMNYHWSSKEAGQLYGEFLDLMKGEPFYFEMGNAWNCSAYLI